MNPIRAPIAATEKRFASKLGPRSPLSATAYGHRRQELFFKPLKAIIAKKFETGAAYRAATLANYSGN
jgi:hypothetical protein